MMTNSEYVSIRDTLLREQKPFIVLNKNEIVSEGDNYYRIGDMQVAVTPSVQQQLDRQIGLSSRQREGIRQAYGENAVIGLRNGFAMANCVNSPKKFALIANPDELIVDGIVQLEAEAIPMRSFFNIVELFADEYSYEVEQVLSSYNGIYGITVKLMPVHPQYNTFGDDDEFITNGLYMKWNLGELELGNYYLRLVCTNGQMQITRNSLNRIHRIDNDDVMKIINPANTRNMAKRNLEAFKQAVLQARNIPASLAEVHHGKKLLLRHGTPENLAEQLMPYTELLNMYQEVGKHIPPTQAKSNIKMWNLFNRLTDFASHTNLWERTDNRSASLMQQSMELLMCKRDIQTYYDIFS